MKLLLFLYIMVALSCLKAQEGMTASEIVLISKTTNDMTTQKRPSHGGKCELYKSDDDQFYFVLIAPNGQTIVTSETYTRKHNAVKTIKRYFLLFTFKDCTK